jgi:ATP-binding cassette, subfamily B, bacterial CvaB/MchF/RaxB
VLLAYYSTILAALTLSAASVYTITRFFMMERIRQGTRESLIREGAQQGHFIETLRGIHSIKVNGHGTFRASAWFNLYVDAINANVSTQRLLAHAQNAARLIFGVERVLLVCGAFWMVIKSELTLGMAMALIAYRELFAQRAASLIDNFAQIGMLKLEIERLGDILYEPPEIDPFPADIGRFVSTAVNVKLDGITICLAKGLPPVLDDCCAEIKAGECVALVGASGSGKSTLVKAILGLLPLDSGKVELYAEVGDVRFPAGRSAVAAVLQDDHLFAGTIAENVSMFDQNCDMGRVRDACARAAISIDIERMSMQYLTYVGDMGTTLSGGQKQRLFLARAIYRSPGLLVLDEATSHLDVGIEALIATSLKELKSTILIVAHRPETIALADRVLRLRQGRLIEVGHPVHSRTEQS